MPLSRLLTHSTWIGLDFSASAAPSYTSLFLFSSVSFFCALIPSILWIFLSMQGRRRQKFTCKVASCDNDRKKATAQRGARMWRMRLYDAVSVVSECVCCLWQLWRALCVLAAAFHNLSLKFLSEPAIRNFWLDMRAKCGAIDGPGSCRRCSLFSALFLVPINIIFV